MNGGSGILDRLSRHGLLIGLFLLFLLYVWFSFVIGYNPLCVGSGYNDLAGMCRKAFWLPGLVTNLLLALTAAAASQGGAAVMDSWRATMMRSEAALRGVARLERGEAPDVAALEHAIRLHHGDLASRRRIARGLAWTFPWFVLLTGAFAATTILALDRIDNHVFGLSEDAILWHILLMLIPSGMSITGILLLAWRGPARSALSTEPS